MLSNISPLQLIIILVIVLLLFGTKKLRNIGSDLGGAVKGFKKAVSEDDADGSKTEGDTPESAAVEEKTSSEK